MPLAQLKLGISEATLVVMPSPNLPDGMPRGISIKRIEEESVDNQRSITYLGAEKEDITLEFTKLREADFALIRQYCNTGEYYCVIESSLRQYFTGWVEVRLDSITEDMHTPDFRRDMTVILRQL